MMTRREPTTARARRGTLAAAVLVLGGCEGAVRPGTAPAFAADLPGHTVAVLWSEDAPLVPDLPSALAEWLQHAPVRRSERMLAWMGDASAVGWRSLADNGLFLAAYAEAPPGERHLFLDLQQLVDLLGRAGTTTESPSAWSSMRGLVWQRVLDALQLGGLQWCIAGEHPLGEQRRLHAVLAATDMSEGLCGLFASGAPPALPAQIPRQTAAVTGTAHFVPAVALRIVRDLIGGEGHGPLLVLREMLRGPRLEAGLAAMRALGGSLAGSAGSDFGWLWASVADVSTLADALDAIAEPAADGWRIGEWRLRVADGALTAELGAVPEPDPFPRPAAALWLDIPAARLRLSANGDAAAQRLRLDLELASPRGR